jgi:hypothetical protein
MKASSVVSIALALLLLALVGIPLAQDKPALAAGDPSWWNASWGYRKQLAFNNCGQGENLINFTVLVKLTASNFNYSHCRNDGGDIRFVDADNSTLLKYHFEEWNYDGDSWIWVKAPQIDGGSSTDYIWLYYGNSEATDAQDEAGTYDANFMGVWHVDEVAEAVDDSTSYSNDGSIYGDVTQDATGKIDGADDFGGDQDGVDIPSSSGDELSNFSELTLEAWIDIDTYNPEARIVSKAWDVIETDPYGIYALALGADGANNIYVSVTTGASRVQCFSAPGSISTAGFYYVVGTWDGEYVQSYVDGEASGGACVKSGTMDQNDEDVSIGRYTGGWPGTYDLDGIIDEVRISNVARSADWIKAQYLSMTDAFITFGLEQVPLPLISGWGWCLAYKEVGDVTLDLAGSMVPRANAPEVVDLHLVGTLNFSIPGRTDTFELELLGTRVRSLFFLKQVEGGADPLIAEFEGFWLAENNYIACEGRLAITTPNHAAQPYAFVLRTGGVDVPSREPGGWVEDIEFIIQKGALALDRVGDRLAQGGAVIKDLLGTVLTGAAVLVREVRKLGAGYIP